MMENNIAREWFEESKSYKLSARYKHIFPKYFEIGKFDKNDDFKTHLEKCIEVYVGGALDFYNGCIYGFFRHIPTSFEYLFSASNWSRISKKWEEKYRHIKFVK